MDADRLVFGLLGPLEVWVGDTRLPVPGTKRRVLLAHLLLRANQVVRADDLIDAIWPADPPRSARANLQTYVSVLRRCLPDGPSGPRIGTHGNGYLVEVAPGELDATNFENLLATARAAQADGHLAEVLRLLDDGLRLWRGDPLSDLPDHRGWRTSINRLTELRLGALEQHARARIGLGQHTAASTELRALIDTHPFRESLWEHLMVALHAAGRRAEALSAYREIRDLLVTELGVEPGHQLTSIHQAILVGDQLSLATPAPVTDGRRETAAPARATPADPPTPEGGPATRDGPVEDPQSDVARWPAVPPRQLPSDIPDFTGRANRLDELHLLLTATGPGQSPPVGIIVGAPGTGKSTLAVHAAHRAAAGFPDGQLYLDLRGCTATPRAPTHVYREVLRALGVSGAAIPRRTSERAALYRSMLARRRMLLVLDDVGEAQHVRDLLPPGGGCAVLVTSRRQLSIIPGAHAIVLDAFAAGEARQLLSQIAGAERIDREPAEAAAICRSCGNLPLAIRVAGAKLAERRSWTLRILADRLDDESRRLSELHVDDVWLRASFELSVRQLPDDAATAFRLLGLLNTTTLPGWVIGALLGRAHADDVLDALVDANLVQLLGPDASGQPRYRLHDLLHCYAVEAVAGEPAELRAAALRRVTAGWLALAERAATALPACVFSPTPGDAARWCPDPTAAARTVREPLTWFDAERQSLVDAVELAARSDLPGLAWELAVAVVPYFDHRSCYPDWQRANRSALCAARAAGDTQGEAALLRGLGQVLLYQDRYAEARAMMTGSRTLSRRIGDRRGVAVAASGLGSICRVTGNHDRAVDHYREALAELAIVDDPNAEAQVRNAMGMICRERGRFDEARGWFSAALRLARGIGEAHREAIVLGQIGVLHLDEAHPQQALRCLRGAVGTFDRLNDEHCAGYALEAIGRAELLLNDPFRAQLALDRALSIFRTTGDRRGQATVTELLGELHLTRHDMLAASTCSDHASALWQQIGVRPNLPLPTTAPLTPATSDHP